jgi:hypothetical protein
MATPTYEPIATTTLGSNQATITFSSIPSTYTDLVIVSNFGTSTASYPYLRFNGDTGSNYSVTDLSGNGSSAVSARESGGNKIWLSYNFELPTTLTSNLIVNVQNYANSTTYKTTLSRVNNAANGTGAIVGLWRSTAAITSLTLNMIKLGTGYDFTAGSTFTLYGIKAA